jgi:hypothetical protein
MINNYYTDKQFFEGQHQNLINNPNQCQIYESEEVRILHFHKLYKELCGF